MKIKWRVYFSYLRTVRVFAVFSVVCVVLSVPVQVIA